MKGNKVCTQQGIKLLHLVTNTVVFTSSRFVQIMLQEQNLPRLRCQLTLHKLNKVKESPSLKPKILMLRYRMGYSVK